MTTSAKTKIKESHLQDDNAQLAQQVVACAIERGVQDFCICPGARNSPLYHALMETKNINRYFWYEERSAAYFALGKCKASGRPAAVVTTSGTAAGELLPAAMESYYSGMPLLMITADRPRRFRGTGAPQSAEQTGLFGCYAPTALDIAHGEAFSLAHWNLCAPAHINACFEDPFPQVKQALDRLMHPADPSVKITSSNQALVQFLEEVKYPLVIVSALKPDARPLVADFLLQLNAPVILEAVSGLREDSRLYHLRITRTEQVWQSAAEASYPIDGVLRIGSVPTIRIWRDLDDLQGNLQVCSISDLPFPGLCWGSFIHTSLTQFFQTFTLTRRYDSAIHHRWKISDRTYYQHLQELFHQEPQAEPSLVFELSQSIPAPAHIYLGNSLPIREWDMAATDKNRALSVFASRGVNGIDGQISTFLGMSTPGVRNWAILGDLTALYDLAGPWILPQMRKVDINLVIINNGGGQIFAKMCPQREFLHTHSLSFEHVAQFWGIHYERWTSIPPRFDAHVNRIIEIVPDNAATERFRKKVASL